MQGKSRSWGATPTESAAPTAFDKLTFFHRVLVLKVGVSDMMSHADEPDERLGIEYTGYCDNIQSI